jgi:nucleotide-binding universal stress UspA family protein
MVRGLTPVKEFACRLTDILASMIFERSRPMSYKTILVHLTNPRRSEALLEPAIALASRFNAHLIGLHASLGVTLWGTDNLYGSESTESALAAERKDAEQIAATFARMTANQPLTADWRAIEAPFTDPAAAVVKHARCVDLVMASQADPDWPRSPLLDFPERLALESGRPVLLIPCVGRYPSLGRNVVVAWKPVREAARAAFDALPLLKGADAVHVLEVTEPGSTRSSASPDTSIAAALGRHGLKPILRSSLAVDISIGDEILSRLADVGADLLVMGAYGHSRLRELVFGGATRHIAQCMTVPTLFSH